MAGESAAPAAAPAPAVETPQGEAVVATEDVRSRQEQKQAPHDDGPLYANRVKVYPKAVDGRMRRIKWGALLGLLGLYYLVPWLRWDRGPNLPDQAVLIDMPARRAYFFFIEIWPQEVYYLTFLLMLAAFGLFLATSLFGRVWCGYACPQTVWTDLFMWVERRIEGDRNARIRLDSRPWSADKLARKVSKHAVWLVIALLTGGAWAMYFNDAPEMVARFFTGQASLALYFFVGLFTATTYLLAGWAREQVCTYMCPWPRIQAALLDEDSLVVTYRSWRGEPRGKHKKGESWEGRGDCVDCRQCVAVCPTGIDIRDGIQLECIGCGLCMDACDTVMDKVGRPRGLIAWDSERNLEREARGESPVLRLIRARTIIYAALVAAVGLGMLYGLTTRGTIELNVLHDRNPLFVTLSDGSIRDGYEVKLLNKNREETEFALRVEGLEGARLDVVGLEGAAEGTASALVTAPGDSVASYRVFVQAPRDSLGDEATGIDFVVENTVTGEIARRESVFRGPEQ
ncbi:MAG: cytochrome c oxidase accessory protein CcoG [Azospirillaceae bacterium]